MIISSFCIIVYVSIFLKKIPFKSKPQFPVQMLPLVQQGFSKSAKSNEIKVFFWEIVG